MPNTHKISDLFIWCWDRKVSHKYLPNDERWKGNAWDWLRQASHAKGNSLSFQVLYSQHRPQLITIKPFRDQGYLLECIDRSLCNASCKVIAYQKASLFEG
jgi:hypothetical protein